MVISLIININLFFLDEVGALIQMKDEMQVQQAIHVRI
jgi:hypothetical protein